MTSHLPASDLNISRSFAYLVLVFGVMAVGAIDYFSGEDIQVLSLYFVPLTFAGWYIGRFGAVIASLFATMVWLASFYAGGTHYLAGEILITNAATQAVAFLAVSMLVAALAESLRKERSLSRTDALTGLDNRMAFIERSNVALLLCRRHARPVSIAYIDLDNFKSANDTHVHSVGDALPRLCGRTIGEVVRSSDITARLGGDEFAIFFPETTAPDARLLMDRFQINLGRLPEFQSAGVTASVGIATNPTATSEIDDLLKQADARMYQTKLDHRNGIDR